MSQDLKTFVDASLAVSITIVVSLALRIGLAARIAASHASSLLARAISGAVLSARKSPQQIAYRGSRVAVPRVQDILSSIGRKMRANMR
jgi:hypothetical protein